MVEIADRIMPGIPAERDLRDGESERHEPDAEAEKDIAADRRAREDSLEALLLLARQHVVRRQTPLRSFGFTGHSIPLAASMESELNNVMSARTWRQAELDPARTDLGGVSCDASEPAMILPEDCETMAEVRAGVDAVYRRIVDLLALRFRFMTAAGLIMLDRGWVRDVVRKALVIANAKAAAARAGVPPEVVGDLWERLVEGSIAYEFDRWDDHRR